MEAPIRFKIAILTTLIGFINTNIIDATQVKFYAADTEANLLRSLVINENKDIYSFLTTSSECYCLVRIWFPLYISQGYSNVIDELCMRVQFPLYSPRD